MKIQTFKSYIGRKRKRKNNSDIDYSNKPFNSLQAERLIALFPLSIAKVKSD